MKREDLLAKGFTQEQVTEILNMFHNTNQENAALQSQIDSAKQFEAKYNEAQKQLDAIAQSQMTEQEKMAAQKAETEKNLRESRIIVNKAVAKEILAGYDVDDALIEKLVDEDKDATVASANLFKTKLETLAEASAKKAKEELTKLDVKPNPTNVPTGEPVMTKEKFNAMTMVQQKAWKDANIDKYREWYPQK